MNEIIAKKGRLGFMKPSRAVMAAVLASGWMVGTVCAQDPGAAQPVEGADLVKSPQKFWARSIVFTDTLTSHPAGGALRLDRSRVVAFDTLTAGRCYADDGLVPKLRDLPLDQRYHFNGTVLNHRGRYYVVVTEAVPALREGEVRFGWPGLTPEEAADARKQQALRPLLDILTAAQSAQMSYAREQKLDLAALYQPDTPSYTAALNLLRASARDYELKNKTTSADILAQYLMFLLAQHEGAAPEKKPVKRNKTESAPAVEPAPAESPVAPAPEAVTPPPPAAEAPSVVEEAPKRLSWRERRALAREEKEKEKAALEAAKAEVVEETPEAPKRLSWRERRALAREERAREKAAREAAEALEADAEKSVPPAEPEKAALTGAGEEEAKPKAPAPEKKRKKKKNEPPPPVMPPGTAPEYTVPEP